MMTSTFEIKDKFYSNGKEVKIISGGMHYFRIVPEYWRDRLEKLKALGCNTVETYVPWNLHEPKKGEFRFEGIYDVKAFVELAQELGLWVILRPSPYICAEWEFGGLPGWLLAEDGMRVRGCYQPFLNHVEDYFRVFFEYVKPLQLPYGGPIIFMQIENEYGYFGNDTNYMEAIKNMMVENGVVVPLVTSDGPWGDALTCGKLDGVLATGNFGSHMEEQFNRLETFTEGGPLMCMEFWVGWFDHWGSGGHMTSDLELNCKDLEEGLRRGNINIYMFIGGTNFGFMNGSNYYDQLTPDVTSYDYDAVLTEDGAITPKYLAFQKVISQFTELPKVELTTTIIQKDYGRLEVKDKVSLFESLSDLAKPLQSVYPLSMEKLGQNYGYTLYLSEFQKEKNIDKIRLWGANDRAIVHVNSKPILTLYDRELLEEHTLGYSLEEGSTISILMENMGRVNFGLMMDKQRKGIDHAVQINGHQHLNWTHFPLPLDNLENLDFSLGWKSGVPAFYRFETEIDQIGDTFVDLEGWGKGCVVVNGFNIGRFWEIGPQKRLYLPGPLLRKGRNEIIVFETEGKVAEHISLKDEPDLGPLQKNK